MKTATAYADPLRAPERRALYEYQLALDCLLPFLAEWQVPIAGQQVLDLGCGGGGTAVALGEHGAVCIGIDHNAERIAEARKLAAQHQLALHFQVADVLRMKRLEPAEPFANGFDLIVLSEVVEHLEQPSNVASILNWCCSHLNTNGKIYVSFPPWFSPFAGHQAGWPTIQYLPWYHLLPDQLKQWLVPQHAPRYLNFIQELNQLTIGTFEDMVGQTDLQIVKRSLFHLRPEFYWRYGVPTLKAAPFLANIPVAREVLTTGAYYLLGH